jgi:hypothetical protein
MPHGLNHGTTFFFLNHGSIYFGRTPMPLKQTHAQNSDYTNNSSTRQTRQDKTRLTETAMCWLFCPGASTRPTSAGPPPGKGWVPRCCCVRCTPRTRGAPGLSALSWGGAWRMGECVPPAPAPPTRGAYPANERCSCTLFVPCVCVFV